MSYPDGVFVDISVLCHVNNGHNRRGLPLPSVLVSVHFTISKYFIRSFRYRYITLRPIQFLATSAGIFLTVNLTKYLQCNMKALERVLILNHAFTQNTDINSV